MFYNCFVMIYILVITLLLQTLVVKTSPLNVRTALFTPADMSKKKWNRRDIALLKARVYLQDLIPPFEVSSNPDYVKSLIRYIQDCYATVKREANPQTESVLKAAVSDVLGGYLKMIALPITKYDYYSGDVATQDALQLFEYYNDIKKHLRTRGESWSGQFSSILKTRNRGARSHRYFMKINDPCQKLMYIQTTKQNFSMPMPAIDWDTRMMFVPLTDHPIVNLRSPIVEPVLLKFHQIASACERSVSPSREFQDLFNSWMKQTVVPHLSDEDMYTGFKGILSIIDNDDTGCSDGKCSSKFRIRLPFDLSIPTFIIVILLILEMMCCIPTLLYTLRKKSNRASSTSAQAPPGRRKIELFNRRKSKTNTSAVNCVTFKTIKRNSDFTSSNLESRCSNSSTDVATVVEDVPCKSSKYSSRKRSFRPSYRRHFHYKDMENDDISPSKSQTHVSSGVLVPYATSTEIDVSNKTSETMKPTIIEREKSEFNEVKKYKRFKRHASSSFIIDHHSPNSTSDHQCMTPVLGDNKVVENSKISTAGDLLLIFGDKLRDKAVQSKAMKKVDFVSPNISISLTDGKIRGMRDNLQIQKIQNISQTQRTSELKALDNLRSQNSPNVAITIDTSTHKQQTNSQTPKLVPEHVLKTSIGLPKDKEEEKATWRPSKIPKKIGLCSTQHYTTRPSSSPSHASKRLEYRYMIQKLAKTQDDGVAPAPAQATNLNKTL